MDTKKINIRRSGRPYITRGEIPKRIRVHKTPWYISTIVRWWNYHIHWRGIPLPTVKHTFGTPIVSEMMGVHPMDLPSGLIFHLDFETLSKSHHLDYGIDITARNIVRELKI